MAGFSSGQRKELIKRVDTLIQKESFSLKRQAIGAAITQEKIDNVFEGDARPYSVLQKTVRDAVVIYADSSATLQDALQLEEVVNKATDTFVRAAHKEMTQSDQQIYKVYFLQEDWNREIFQETLLPSQHQERAVREGGFQNELSNKLEAWGSKIADKVGIKPDAFQNELNQYIEVFASKEYGISKHAGESEQDFIEKVKEILKVKRIPLHVFLEKHLAFVKEKHANDVHPLALLMYSARVAAAKYAANDCDKAAHEALKKDIDAATDACVARYKGKVDPTTLDYVKAAGLFIVGVIVGLATFYLLPYKPYRDFVKSTFFSPVESKVVDTTESKAVQKAAAEGKLTDIITDAIDEASAYKPHLVSM